MLRGLHIRVIKYGWIPDLPDQRDFSYSLLAPEFGPLPQKVDLRLKCSSVENQGDLGSCTAQALVGNLEFLKRGKNFSPLFLYYNERLIRRMTAVDSGASLRDGIKSLVKVGDCLEKLWPYQINKFAVKPSALAYRDALNYQVLNYYRLGSIWEMKHTLYVGFPFVFGFAVYASFESDKVAKTGMIPMPAKKERMIGGHAVMAVGFDEAKKHFIIRNSWGRTWGDGSYGFIPYQYLENESLSSDFWTIRGMEKI